MATAKNALIQFENGGTLRTFSAMADSGDHTLFSATYSPWSKAIGREAIVLPNGVATGGNVIPAVSATNDRVDVTALTCYLAGVLTSVSAGTDVAVTRGAGGNPHLITSITVDSTGAIAAVAGTGGTAFSEVRDAAGGPPYIPGGSIELAQVRLSSATAGVVLASEIFAVVGQHRERYDYPTWATEHLTGKITFSSALPLSHTGGVTKRAYYQAYTPSFVDIPNASDFVPAEISASVSSTQVYGGVVGSESTSLGQAKFNAHLADGHTDPLLAAVGDVLIFKFKSDKNRAPYSLTQGRLAISRTYPAAGSMVAACTISAESKTLDFVS